MIGAGYNGGSLIQAHSITVSISITGVITMLQLNKKQLDKNAA